MSITMDIATWMISHGVILFFWDEHEWSIISYQYDNYDFNQKPKIEKKIESTMVKANHDKDHIVYAPSQLEMTLQCNVISHWLAAHAK